MSAEHQRAVARARERRGLEVERAAADLVAISREHGLPALAPSQRLLVLLVAAWGAKATLGDLSVGAGLQPHTVRRHLRALVVAELLEEVGDPARWELHHRLQATRADLCQDGLTAAPVN